MIQLFHLKEGDPQWRGYIVVYAAPRSHIGEAQFKANCYKNYLVRVRKMDPASLFAVDGVIAKTCRYSYTLVVPITIHQY